MGVDGKDHPEMIPMAIAAFVAVVSIAAMALLDFRPGHSQSDADGMITSAVLSRAGAIATPSEKPTWVKPGHNDHRLDHEHPVVLPHVSHFMQVPLRTRVKLPHSEHISPS
jgi:hypothetical protein